MACAGSFTTSRRVVLSPIDVINIKDAHRGVGGLRPVGVQVLANRYGVSMQDIRHIVQSEGSVSEPKSQDRADHWTLGTCSDVQRKAIREIALRRQISMARIADPGVKDKAALEARSEVMWKLREMGVSNVKIADIFRRDRTNISLCITKHRKRLTAPQLSKTEGKDHD